jgi:hypothetical protein
MADTLITHIEDLTVAIRYKLNLMNKSLRPAAITMVVDGGGMVITSGNKLDVEVPFDCIIMGWTILADRPGTAEIDLWKTNYANAPPTLSNTIVSTSKPILSGNSKAQASNLTGWDRGISAGDIIRVNVDAASLVTRLTFTLQVLRG